MLFYFPNHFLNGTQGAVQARDASNEKGKRSHNPQLKKRSRLDGAYAYVVLTVEFRYNAAVALLECAVGACFCFELPAAQFSANVGAELLQAS